MIFHPLNTLKKKGSFVFQKEVFATTHPCLCKSIFLELWHGFCHHLSSLQTEETNDLIFRIGSAEPIPLGG